MRPAQRAEDQSPLLLGEPGHLLLGEVPEPCLLLHAQVRVGLKLIHDLGEVFEGGLALHGGAVV